MTTMQPQTRAVGIAYDLEGTLLEACDCGTLCPCWVGEDPDGGTCEAVVAYHFDRGEASGADIGGLSLALAVQIPGNILAGGWKVAVFVDEQASDQQMQALLDVYTGKLGGPLADLAQLIGEVVAVERAPIAHHVTEGAGTLQIGDAIGAEMQRFTGPDGSPTTLQNTVFSTVPGAPAYVAKAGTFTVNLPQYGMVWSHTGRNAIQSDYHIVHEGGA